MLVQFVEWMKIWISVLWFEADDATTHSIADALNSGFLIAESESVQLVERITTKIDGKNNIDFYYYKSKMSRDNGVYIHPSDDAQAHARWVLTQMGHGASVNHNVPDTGSSDYNDNREEYIFGRLHKKWLGMELKYVRQKSGGGCGSGKRFVPVSCSKKCRYCHGCSPGCGRNYEFETIDNFDLSENAWASLWKKFDEEPGLRYISRRY
jgi:hypothetical protein